MTKKQTLLYWREWAAVRAVNPIADRHQLHQQALGKSKSSKEFTNSDFDKVLAVFRSVSDPGNLLPQLRAMDQARARLEYVLSELTQCLGVYVKDPAGYVARVVQDRCRVPAGGSLEIHDLSHEPNIIRNRRTGELEEKPSELKQVVMTISARLHALRKGRGHSLADMYEAAGIPQKGGATERTPDRLAQSAPRPTRRGRGSHGASGSAMALADTDGQPGPEEDQPF